MTAVRLTWQKLGLVVALGLVVLTVGDLLHRSTPDERRVHVEGDGPLSASSGTGGLSINPPPPPPWTASFGALILCVRQNGQQARIEGVRSAVQPRGVKLHHLLRVVPPVAERPVGFSWVDYFSNTAAFPGSDRRKPHGGTVQSVEDAVIDQPCSEVNHTRDNGYTDLLTELTVDERGATVKKTEIDYTVGGRRYTLVVRWEMTACGTATSREHC